mgnify:CR=1 FL=1
MKTNSIIAGVALIALAGAVPMAKASITFTAAATGDVTAYYVAGDAADIDLVGMLDITRGDTLGALSGSDFYLNNHSTAVGTSATLGSVNAGDTLVFVLQNQTTGNYIFSDPTLNAGGINYIQSSSFSGSGSIPAGTYVGFEDLLATEGSDFDYNDLEFVFQNVDSHTPQVGSVPEPSTIVAGALLLLPFGVSTVRILRNRKRAGR